MWIVDVGFSKCAISMAHFKIIFQVYNKKNEIKPLLNLRQKYANFKRSGEIIRFGALKDDFVSEFPPKYNLWVFL